MREKIKISHRTLGNYVEALKCVSKVQRKGPLTEAQFAAVALNENADAVVSLSVSLFVFILVSPVT